MRPRRSVAGKVDTRVQEGSSRPTAAPLASGGPLVLVRGSLRVDWVFVLSGTAQALEIVGLDPFQPLPKPSCSHLRRQPVQSAAASMATALLGPGLRRNRNASPCGYGPRAGISGFGGSACEVA